MFLEDNVKCILVKEGNSEEDWKPCFLFFLQRYIEGKLIIRWEFQCCSFYLSSKFKGFFYLVSSKHWGITRRGKGRGIYVSIRRASLINCLIYWRLIVNISKISFFIYLWGQFLPLLSSHLLFISYFWALLIICTEMNEDGPSNSLDL